MKKAKEKKEKIKRGFTLIELLAAVVILALIVIFTIPLMLDSLTKAREKQFENSVSALAVWLEKQYDLYDVRETNASVDFINFCEPLTEPTLSCNSIDGIKSGNDEFATTSLSSGTNEVIQFIKASGLNPEDFSYVKVNYNNSYHKLCVNLTASDSGEFKELAGTMKKSSGCS